MTWQNYATNDLPFLTKEEELALLEIVHHSEDEKERIDARNELVMRNIRLIFLTTKKSRRFGFTIEECMGVAVDAFMYSISKFDFRDVRLSTYAVTAIRHMVTRWASEQRGVLRTPAVFLNKKAYDKSSDSVKRALAVARRPQISTDHSRSDNSGDAFDTIGQQLPFRDVDGATPHGPSLEEFNAAVNKLTGRSWVIISMRLEGATLGTIGFALGVTRERVRQLEKKAREQLRRLLQHHYAKTSQ